MIELAQNILGTQPILAVFLAIGVGVVALRRSAFGRRLVAMRDSPAACATLGVNLFFTKLAVFGISAAIASDELAGFAGVEILADVPHAYPETIDAAFTDRVRRLHGANHRAAVEPIEKPSGAVALRR
jgi:ABC-type branched-subunit amino acid transport system permease subunit